MIELKEFEIGYSQKQIVKNGNIRIENGALTALIGRNGAGKSTILRCISGLNNRYTGKIQIDGESIRNLSALERAKRLAFVNTEKVRISNLRCRDIVGMGRAPYTDWRGKMEADDRKIVDRSMAIAGIEQFADRTMDTMSDGECQRVMIARALAQDTQNLILDEPTSFLDVPSRYQLVDLLSHLAKEEGKCVFYSTHELNLALEKSDYVVIMGEGTLEIFESEDPLLIERIHDKFGNIGRL